MSEDRYIIKIAVYISRALFAFAVSRHYELPAVWKMITILDKPFTAYGEFKFPFQCVALKVLGVWPVNVDVFRKPQPNQARLLAYLYYAWAYLMVVLIALTCYAQTWFVIAAWGDILTVTECGCTVLMGLHNLLRLIHLNSHRESLFRLNRAFVRDIWISRFG